MLRYIVKKIYFREELQGIDEAKYKVILSNAIDEEIIMYVSADDLLNQGIEEGDYVEINEAGKINKVYTYVFDTSNIQNMAKQIDVSGIAKSLSGMRDAINQIFTPTLRETITQITNAFAAFSKAINSEYTKSIRDSLLAMSKAYSEAKNNPNSFINYYDYQEKLDNFHWAWPYGITAQELKTLLENVDDEKQFDNKMASFFTSERLAAMFEEIKTLLPRKHKVVFEQIVFSFDNKNYALVNNGLMSIIDNILILPLKNRGCVNRSGILHPIITFYADNYSLSKTDFLFELQMLSNNVDLLFYDYDFNKKIHIDSNKKVRRHLSTHGQKYSNNRTDAIMIFNTLWALLINIDYLSPFKRTLIRKKKIFCVDTKDYVIVNRIYKELEIQKEIEGGE